VRTRWFRASLLAVAVGLAVPVGCGETAHSSGKIGVVVTILPQVEFVENVGGEKVDVTVMVPAGKSPHFWEPLPSQMKAMARAEIYAKVGSGVEFELVWLEKLVSTNKEIVVVDCSAGIQLIQMAGNQDHGDEEPEEEHHNPGAMDPHIWMSPLKAKIMVQNICDGLVQVDPGNRAFYEQNRDAYLQELTELDEDIREALFGVTNRKFMVYHPSFGYFAKEYNLTMLSVEEEGKEPTPAGIVHLIEQAKEDNIKAIFASPQFNPRSAEVIADEIGGSVVLIDSLAGDYIANLRTVLGELVQAME